MTGADSARLRLAARFACGATLPLEVFLHLAGVVGGSGGEAAGRAAVGAVDLLAGALVAAQREVGVADGTAVLARHVPGDRLRRERP